MNYTNIRDKMVEASQYANEGVLKFQEKIGFHKQLSDLESDLDAADKNIEKQEYILKSQNQSVIDKLDIQIEQTEVDMNKVSESHVDTINSC